MIRILIGLTVLALTLSVPFESLADCRGCCSHHEGVVCLDGVTMCGDGSPLSKRCREKGCNKCLGVRDKQIDQRKLADMVRQLKVTPKSRGKRQGNPTRTTKSVSRRGTYKPTGSGHVTQCECDGIIHLTNFGGCPCENEVETAD